MKNYLLVGGYLFLLGCTSASTDRPLPENISHMSSTTKFGCRFEKHFSGRQESGGANASAWYFWRDGSKIEMRDALSNQGEIWEKDKNGKLSYSRLFFNEGIALEFTQGDLAALDLAPSWKELNFIIHQDELGKSLKLADKEQTQQSPIEHYQGNIDGVDTEVDWLPTLQLPVRIVKKLKSGDFTLILAQCGEDNLSGLQPSGAKSSNNLRHIDFTDLGDMEEDPDVQQIERLIGAHHD